MAIKERKPPKRLEKKGPPRRKLGGSPVATSRQKKADKKGHKGRSRTRSRGRSKSKARSPSKKRLAKRKSLKKIAGHDEKVKSLNRNSKKLDSTFSISKSKLKKSRSRTKIKPLKKPKDEQNDDDDQKSDSKSNRRRKARRSKSRSKNEMVAEEEEPKHRRKSMGSKPRRKPHSLPPLPRTPKSPIERTRTADEDHKLRRLIGSPPPTGLLNRRSRRSSGSGREHRRSSRSPDYDRRSSRSPERRSSRSPDRSPRSADRRSPRSGRSSSRSPDWRRSSRSSERGSTGRRRSSSRDSLPRESWTSAGERSYDSARSRDNYDQEHTVYTPSSYLENSQPRITVNKAPRSDSAYSDNYSRDNVIISAGSRKSFQSVGSLVHSMSSISLSSSLTLPPKLVSYRAEDGSSAVQEWVHDDRSLSSNRSDSGRYRRNSTPSSIRDLPSPLEGTPPLDADYRRYPDSKSRSRRKLKPLRK